MSKLVLFCPKCREKVILTDREASGQIKCKLCEGPLFFERAVSEEAPPESSAVLRAQNLGPGKRLGDFDIVQVVGKGGMGMVYEAVNLKLKRTVALKVMRPDFALSDPDNVRRLYREAQAAARLIHPNIVTLFSIGEQEGLHYIEMEYIPGPTSGDLATERGRLDLGLALYILRDAASGLAAAHRQKIVHRDIKPDNILVHPEGIAKVSDFGLAKSFADEPGESPALRSDITLPGIAIGTPHFMSPEQCEAKPLDGRSDLYSLGCTFFYLLTGARPYRGGTTMTVMRQHLFDPPPDITLYVPDAPEAVAALIFKLMEKDIRKRYQTAEELLDDIDRIPVPVDASLGGSDLTREFRKRSFRTPVTVPVPSPASPRETAVTKLLEPESGPQARQESHLLPVIVGLALSAMVILTVSAVWLIARYRGGPAIRPLGEPASVNASLHPAAPPPKDGEKGPPAKSLQDHLTWRFPTTIYDVALDEKNMVVAAAGDDSFVHLWDVRADRIVRKLEHPSAVLGVDFSPDGAYLASVAGSFLRLWRTETFKEAFSLERASEELRCLAFGPHGTMLVTGSTKGFQFWGIPGGVLKASIETTSPVTTVSFGPDSQALMGGDESGMVHYWRDFEVDPHPRQIPAFEKQPILSARLSGDLQWLAVSAPQRFVVNSLTESRPRIPAKDEENEHPEMAIARDARFVAVGRDDGTVLFLDTNMKPIAKRKRFHGDREIPGTYWFRKLRLSQSGDWLLSSSNDGSVSLFKTASIELEEP